MQASVGLCVSATVRCPLPRIHSMGRSGQPGVQGGRPQRTGTSLGKSQGEHILQASVVYLTRGMVANSVKQALVDV